MKKILICDKNKALANYIKIRMRDIFIVDRYKKSKEELIREKYNACILIMYDRSDLFELITITKYQKNIIIGTSSKEIISYIKSNNNFIPFFDIGDTKVDICNKITTLVSMFQN